MGLTRRERLIRAAGRPLARTSTKPRYTPAAAFLGAFTVSQPSRAQPAGMSMGFIVTSTAGPRAQTFPPRSTCRGMYRTQLTVTAEGGIASPLSDRKGPTVARTS